MYIEKASYTLARITRSVLPPPMVWSRLLPGHGALRVPAAAFAEEVQQVEKAIREVLQGINSADVPLS